MKVLNNKFNKAIVDFTICIFLLAAGASCKKTDWYDQKTDKSLAVPSTLKDMQALMDNANVMNVSTPGLGEVASDGHYILDYTLLLDAPGERNAYTWSNEDSFQSSLDWNISGQAGTYLRIYYANLVLDGIQNIKVSGNREQKEWSNIKGQALFHRAHAFYELAQIFAPPYESSSANTKLGIPLRLESDVNIPTKRSTLQQTYDKIISDLLLANELLPENPIYMTRPSKQAVYALLARCYLSMEKYVEAGEYANLCLKNYNSLMEYKTLDVSSLSNPFIDYNQEIIFYSNLMTYPSINLNKSLVDKELYDSYVEQDLRKKAFYNVSESNNLITYKGTYSGRGFNNCFSGLATDEIYLIRAECYARAGKIIEAMADLNALLKTRWVGAYSNLTANDADDALRKVLNERRKELIFRGLRWSDLRRLNRDPRFAVLLTRVVDGKTYTIEPNSYKYTLPIPEDVLDRTGVEQNEGWK